MDRKARLAELRKLKDASESPNSTTEKEKENGELSFRNYNPLTEHVKALKTTLPVDTNAESVLASNSKERVVPKTLEDQAKIIEQDTKALFAKQVATSDSVEITSLAPRKPGFDLAREYERRTERLEKKTNYAIAENIRKRFKDSHDISEVGGITNDGENNDEDDDD
ncbi:hypothetical protein HK100_004900 [Physocladia obscura]|uniref:Uncharacterized protein n=1 Tax=Physocladia obscura TaxID=109957 RepID=A0AAD5XFM4_9FUNG|nr:hypothetical protein HK100_004900 [Physocladia obscura]